MKLVFKTQEDRDTYMAIVRLCCDARQWVNDNINLKPLRKDGLVYCDFCGCSTIDLCYINPEGYTIINVDEPDNKDNFIHVQELLNYFDDVHYKNFGLPIYKKQTENQNQNDINKFLNKVLYQNHQFKLSISDYVIIDDKKDKVVGEATFKLTSFWPYSFVSNNFVDKMLCASVFEIKDGKFSVVNDIYIRPTAFNNAIVLYEDNEREYYDLDRIIKDLDSEDLE